MGGVALALWGSAFGWTTVAAEYAYDRPKVLQFIRGLLMMDIALAVLATLLWYLTKYYLRPQEEARAIREYLYRAGYRDATMKLLNNRELHLVRPMPPPTTASQSPLDDYLVKQNGHHRTSTPM